ncbi:cystathionine gamma-synthase [Suhomyces tanzawaensis NRRL Y-17324]|uniref:Cystathionine gamma-synthase n=1 Tax=Suhomyces tanzawaensis NRRL Y-17324 TaxID=984487 RepID=A0A1E4SS93_9ASCO|nr:cystathionine gamma-synthase [Suhomyces tanzawaensis NRRL Y-17324]ODV82262.1 cystathionine gamma-synthase [Suhomyces tanzawaensis NRRL Y-17324]
MTGLSTRAIHGGDDTSRVPDVIPPINIATTYKYESDPENLIKYADIEQNGEVNGGGFYYSRFSHPNSELVEHSVKAITNAHVVAYSSGLSAFHAALTHYNPKVLAFGDVYHGNIGVANIFTRNQGLKQVGVDNFDQLGKGDLVLLETPVNPDGTVKDISYYAENAHKRGAYLIVDSTFAPPPLQDPFEFGADMVLHSATKFFGGHSDLLAGFLLTKSEEVRKQLFEDRKMLGTIIPNLESSMLLRSLKTLELRVLKQSQNATQIVRYFSENKDKFPALAKIDHGSLQSESFVKQQMPNGDSPVFTISLVDEKTAKYFPSKLKYFHHATSLGGVESLIEWRALSDPRVSPTLLRVSIGIENVEDLIEDLSQALRAS